MGDAGPIAESPEDDEQASKKQRAAPLREQNSKAQKRYRERQLNKRATMQACVCWRPPVGVPAPLATRPATPASNAPGQSSVVASVVHL